MNRFASVLVNVAVISIVTLLTINEVAKVSIIRGEFRFYIATLLINAYLR